MLKHILFVSLASLPWISNAAEGIGKIAKERLLLEVVRQKVDVKMIVTSENMKRYESIAIERAELAEGPYRQEKIFLKDRLSKCADNVLIDCDNYPLAVKNGGFCRVRKEEASRVMRIFPRVQLIGILQEAQMSAGNFTETKNAVSREGVPATAKSRTTTASSTVRDVEEISEGMKVVNQATGPDIFDKVKAASEPAENLSASADIGGVLMHSEIVTKKFKSKNSRDIIETTGSAIAIEDSKDTYEPMYSTKIPNEEGIYTEYLLTGITEENKASKAYRNFMKDNLVKNPDINFSIAIENGSLGSEIKVDKTEKYFKIIVEYSEAKDGIYKPLKKIASAFINDKFVDNKYNIIEPFVSPRGNNELYFRMRLRELDGNESVTKATKVAFP